MHTKPMDLLQMVMRLIKTHFKIDSPALPEGAAEVLSHGCIFSWLEVSTLQHIATRCNTLQLAAAHCDALRFTRAGRGRC